MELSRSNFGMGVVQGRLYAIGGATDASFDEVYDPSTGCWSRIPPMAEPRLGLAVGVVGDNIFASGGYTKSSPSVNITMRLTIDNLTQT
jgi:hypothetical protein